MKATLIVLAKSPLAGRSKTRCCPPCRPAQAATLAAAALADTLEVVAATPAVRRVLVLDGPSGPWRPPGVSLLPQRGRGLDERLAAAFADVGGPALLIGMDTPQLTVELLRSALAALADEGVDAVLGPAADGGYWSIGLRRPQPDDFLGVAMSRADTGWLQLERLERRRRRVAVLPTMRDVDTFADALAVAAQVPGSRFAGAVAEIEAEIEAGTAAVLNCSGSGALGRSSNR